MTLWESPSADLTFTHPLDADLLRAHVPPEARILDYGCGYGRLTAELFALGYAAVEGADPSRALIDRGHREHPGIRLIHAPALPLPYPGGYFDAALLFSVLIGVPEDAAQRAIIAEAARLLRPGGTLYASDAPVQVDAYHQLRYHEAAERGAVPFGVFETDAGVRLRHLAPDGLRALLDGQGFTVVEERDGTVEGLDGRTVRRLQIIASRR